MSFLSYLKILFFGLCNYCNVINICGNKKYKLDRDLGDLLRNVHSIEKGLSLKQPKMGFGYKKMQSAFSILHNYYGNETIMHREEIKMFYDAVKEYIAFHENVGFTNDAVSKIVELHAELGNQIIQSSEKYGGTLHVKNDNKKMIDEAERLFYSRHSVRYFTDDDVNTDDLIKAVELAQHCPSACNRQAVRVHILPKEKKDLMQDWVTGVGGFDDTINTYIIITAKQSYYKIDEYYQYVVSSSIFTGYLTLALQAYGIGACTIQRPVFRTKKWKQVAKELNIAGDEQIICLLGCGCLLKEYNVPVSHRLSVTEICTIH